MLNLRRANSWLCHKDESTFGWNLAKLLDFASLHESLTLKLDRVQDMKCKQHSYVEQIQQLVAALPARFRDGKVGFIFDSAPNRCRQGYQQDWTKPWPGEPLFSYVCLTRDVSSKLSIASIKSLSRQTLSLTLKETKQERIELDESNCVVQKLVFIRVNSRNKINLGAAKLTELELWDTVYFIAQPCRA